MKKGWVLLLVLAGCVSTGMPAEEWLFTDDGVRIGYEYHAGKDKSVGVVLLHMLNRDRSDYDVFSYVLNEKGYPTIAIDLRGHGESDGKWQDFKERDFNAMVLDVKAAKEFLAKKGISEVVLVGASIGANVALKYALQDAAVRGVVALSPGLDYRGVNVEETVKKLAIPVLYVASKEDTYSSLSTQKLAGMTPKAQIKLYDEAGHGTHMFEKEELDLLILKWLKEVTE